MQKHCICIKMGFIQLAHEVSKALAVLTTCTTYTKEDGYVGVTMLTEIGREKVAMLTTG